MIKKELTLYILQKSILWEKEFDNIPSYAKMNKLKIMIILFLISSLNKELIDYYEFHAYQVSPVEKEVLRMIEAGLIPPFSRFGMDFDYSVHYTYNLPEDVKSIIDSSFEQLKYLNNDLIKYSSFDLIDIVKSWNSFRLNKKYNPNQIIDNDEILNDSNSHYA